MRRLLWRVWDRASLYLPLLLMALLALGTYWLVESTPAAFTPVTKAPVRHEPDYFMKNFSVRTYMENGRLKSEVFGAFARHYPDTDTLEIDDVRIRAFDDQDRLTTATANRALTNGDASEVQLFGKALVVREAMTSSTGTATPRMEFRGEFLHAYIDAEKVKSHLPVELRRGQDVFTSDAFDYDNVKRIVNMNGRVRGVMSPAAPR